MTKLGDVVVDTINSFTGVVTGKAEYLHGCVRVLVEPNHLDENGKPIDSEWIDEQRVVVLKKAEEREKEATGGPRQDAPKR